MKNQFGYGNGQRRRKLLSAAPEKAAAQKRAIPNSLFTRVPLEVKIEKTGALCHGRAFLFDFRPASLAFFTAEALDRGAKISVLIEQPFKVFVRAEVVWCAFASRSIKVLHEENFLYRVSARFFFESAAEQDAVRQFCQSLE